MSTPSSFAVVAWVVTRLNAIAGVWGAQTKLVHEVFSVREFLLHNYISLSTSLNLTMVNTSYLPS